MQSKHTARLKKKQARIKQLANKQCFTVLSGKWIKKPTCPKVPENYWNMLKGHWK